MLLGLAILGSCEREGSNAAASAGNPASPSPREATLERSSQGGLYRVSLRRASPERPDHVVHDWLVRVEDADGRLVRPARLAFSGGMPQHGHGFQTAPFVTEALDGGWFRIGGVRFHMAGDWTLRVELVGPAGPDAAVFELAIAP